MLYGHTRKKKLILQLKVFDCHFYLNGHLANPRTLILLSNKLIKIYVQSIIQEDNLRSHRSPDTRVLSKHTKRQ